MNWKVFITACVSVFMVSFPQNIIGCADGGNPYDYYTSFFHNNLPEAPGYRPFYYVAYNFLYDDAEPVPVADVLADEWTGYCGSSATKKDCYDFVNKFAWKDLNNLYYNIEKNQPLKIPDSVKRNSMTDYFIRSKDLEGLGYIMYAKKVEPYATGDLWEPLNRDSIKMDKLIKGGQQLYAVAKKDLFKQKYAYQILRLGHYSGRYADVISWYNSYEDNINKVSTVLQPLCLALKAGAAYRSRKYTDAAYLFSKAFAATPSKRISNYLGFLWSVKSSSSSNEQILAQCKTNAEKATMMAMQAMDKSTNQLDAISTIYKLHPVAPELQLLTVREINKLEEKYLSPNINRQPGGRTFYSYWLSETTDSTTREAEQEAKALHGLLHGMAQSGKTNASALYETGAAYVAYMLGQYGQSEKYMEAAKKMSPGGKVNDQLQLTNLLVSISKQTTIDAAFEEQLLPSVQWLQQKALTDKVSEVNYYTEATWRKFYCNLMGEVLAKRYRQQGNKQKEALCVGLADKMSNNAYSNAAINFFRTQFTSTDVEKMFAFMEQQAQQSRFDKYLLQGNIITKAIVTDFAGTAYLRDYNYNKAIAWFGKTADKKSLVINTNPFVDLLYDREERLPNEARFSTTKLVFAQQMQQLLQQVQSDKANAAKHLYKYALGLYNMTYYGHAWRLVAYDRSGSDGYAMPKDATSFQQQYYGCFAAQEYFKKAMDASTDKNFKARCLFMMAKCTQKQVRRPQYSDFSGNNDWDAYTAAEKAYWPKFKNNTLFPQLAKEYGNTPFYKEVFNTCSYLSDFVRR